jgi:hypothetical protein
MALSGIGRAGRGRDAVKPQQGQKYKRLKGLDETLGPAAAIPGGNDRRIPIE